VNAPQAMTRFDEAWVAPRLRTLLAERVGAEVRIGGLRRFPVGYSWLTYGFDAEWSDAQGAQRRELILRLGPPNGLFAPYSALPQFVALQALQSSGMPLPQVYWHGDDPAALGAPWFICEKVAGRAPLIWGEDFDAATRTALGEQLVDALAALHRYEWRGTPLQQLAGATDPAQAARAQVDYWEGELRRWANRPIPMAEWVLAWLRANAPAAPRVSVVHGDYRIGNFLAEFDGGPRITAILDWELVHLGDPMEDLGYMCQRTFRPGTPLICTLIERETLYRRYAEQSGIAVDPRAVHFHEVLGVFKFFVIGLGAEACYEDGRHNDLRLPSMSAQSPRLLLQLQKLLAEAP
jgi:aminoglycoside phosphotransferase (APT) family kinase protein